jgi:DNA mismatch repair protein MutS
MKTKKYFKTREDRDKPTEETPLMKQYNYFKTRHPGALLLFRVGDFYETFGEDAIKTSRILDIVLTKRANGSASHIELAGFPHHSLENYLGKLIRAGERVAICDQLEDPKFAKGIVKRGVTEVVTPGVSFRDNTLEVKRNNYLCAIHLSSQSKNSEPKGETEPHPSGGGRGGLGGIAFLDITTGEFFTSQGETSYIEKLLQSFNPAEVLYCKKDKSLFFSIFGDQYNTYSLDDWAFGYDFAFEKLTQHFHTANLKGFGIENLPQGITAAGAILQYLVQNEQTQIRHITKISRLEADNYVWLDKFTIRNLELVYPQHEGGIPLIQVLDQSVTPMGGRLMKKWLVLPLKDKVLIDRRLETVSFFVKNLELAEKLLSHLSQTGDPERMISKVATRRINPREILNLKKSLQHILPIKEILQADLEKTSVLQRLAEQLHPCQILLDKIEKEIIEEPPLLANGGGIFREGVNAELDELRKIGEVGKDFLMNLQQKEIQETGISSLKVAFNRIHGYYLEVPNTHKNKVPNTWIRKQTLVGAERYITEELKTYEEKILTAEEKIFAIELRLFNELVLTAGEYLTQIQQNAQVLAQLDCLLSFARAAVKFDYVKPELTEGLDIDIKNGRHPVIERQLPQGEEYVPNDILLDTENQQIMIITGPNMAGKSALLRQTALICLMAQMGSFVPAGSAKLGLVDKVFTRVGASDNLSRGESTFMVEMTETASILNNLSERSLVLMDEIGRGTSTYDGISIAWAIVEFMHNHTDCKAKTLFATHYHELNQLEEMLPRVKNFNVSVREVDNKVIFMRKLKPGGSEHSFGIHVAQMAGMPQRIVLRANEIMHHLEKDKIGKSGKKMKEVPQQNFQVNLFEADPKLEKVKDLLSRIDINTLSPVEALLKLNELVVTVRG